MLNLVLVFVTTLSLSLKQDPSYDPNNYFDVQVGVRCDGHIYGEQGATSMEDCEYNCWVNPLCTWATWDFGGQCSWGSDCTLSNMTTGNVGLRKKGNTLLNFYWGGDTIYRNVIKTETTTLQNAINTCAQMANCTSFGFDSKTHLPTAPVFVSYLNYDQIIDCSALAESWTYYKNATEAPFCDAVVDPTFAPNNKETEIRINYGHCQSGSDIIATLYDDKNQVVSTSTLAQGAGASQLLTKTTSAVNTIWRVEITSDPDFKITVSINIVGGTCPEDGVWDDQLIGSTSTLECWKYSANFTSGNATRECAADGWKLPNAKQCGSGNWNSVQVDFMNDEQKDMFYPDDDHKRMWPSFSYYVFYFPGNKIYGMSYGKFHGDCEKNGFTDIPGNMVQPQYRRMMLAWDGKMPGEVCDNWNVTFLISISELSGKQYINNWITVVHENGKFKSVTSDSEKLAVSWGNEPYHEFNVLRLELSDVTEDTCFNALDKACHETLGFEQDCLTCAAQNRADLKSKSCDIENNWIEVVGFWCKCNTIEDCGGTAPLMPTSQHKRKIYRPEILN